MSLKPLFLTVILSVMLGMVSCSTSRRGVAVAKHPESKSVNKGKSRHDNHNEWRGMHADTKRLLKEAESWLGTPYKYGGNDRDGLDCSGLVVQVYQRALDIKVPRTSRAQKDYCATLSKDDLIPGDLIFFATGKEEGRVTHVGIFIGDGRMIHASTAKGKVVVSEVSTPYFNSHYVASGCVKDYRAKLKIKKGGDNKEVPAPRPLPREVDPPTASAPAPAKTQVKKAPEAAKPTKTPETAKTPKTTMTPKTATTSTTTTQADEPSAEDARAAVLGSINEIPLK